jgi:uncharacterized protein YqjF (DUF2071 family)
MAQSWRDLLFAHWRLPAEQIRPFIPAPLAMDTFQNQAWLAVVPFRMQGVRFRFAPPVPGTSGFPELNVRTYVTLGGKPGVWFFSLDAANWLAVRVARAWFHLPYFHATMNCAARGGRVDYRSERVRSAESPSVFRGSYRPVGEVFTPKKGTLEEFLTERYCLYSSGANGRILRGEIHHGPWRLQNAEAEIAQNSMTAQLGVTLAGRPLVHFSGRQDVVVWAPEVISAARSEN